MNEFVGSVYGHDDIIPFSEIEKVSITDECFAATRRFMRPSNPHLKRFTLVPSKLSTLIRVSLNFPTIPEISIDNNKKIANERFVETFGNVTYGQV